MPVQRSCLSQVRRRQGRSKSLVPLLAHAGPQTAGRNGRTEVDEGRIMVSHAVSGEMTAAPAEPQLGQSMILIMILLAGWQAEEGVVMGKRR